MFLRLRQWLSDWMWNPDSHLPRLRAVLQRGPYYFADPEHLTPEQFDRAMAKGQPVILSGSPWVLVDVSHTTATAGSTSFWVSHSNWPQSQPPEETP